jgi:hypothetical protein
MVCPFVRKFGNKSRFLPAQKSSPEVRRRRRAAAVRIRIETETRFVSELPCLAPGQA